ncbi:MAG TPA: pitrilysin family protein [Gemmatimonadales bacterium]|jgi:predicted Zn-dependent peptidase
MRTLSQYSTGLLGLALLAAPLRAQQGGLDRTKAPTPGHAPTLTVPTWTKAKLANGADLIVTQKHDLPLVAFTISFVGGRANYEPADKPGTASFTSQMLSEGTTTKTGEQFSDAQQLLGTSIFATVGNESGAIGFTALKTKLEPALALVADMLENPTFPVDALERIRGRTVVQLQQAKDRPESIAGNVFQKVLYGDDHPYGRIVTELSVRAITRDDIVAFHKNYFRPGRAIITVTGDVDPAVVRTMVEAAFARWPAGGERPTFAYPEVPALRSTTIYLVDKPGAAQSVFHIGLPGPSRTTPDYYAIRVMNNILGGLFQSRLNHDIREVKGWSYGVNSGFGFGRGPGAFDAGGGIVTAKTDSALVEFMAQLKGIQGGQPFTADEIEQGKASLIQGLPRQFGSVNATGSSVASIYVNDLPENFYQQYAAKIDAVTPADMVRVAKQYIDLGHLDIIIVGDRAVIEPMLRAVNVAPIVRLDADGKPVITP